LVVSLGHMQDDKIAVAKGRLNLAWIWELQGNFLEAKANHKIALETSQQIGYLQGIALGYRNLGIWEMKYGNQKEARSLLKKASGVYKEMNAETDVETINKLILKLD